MDTVKLYNVDCLGEKGLSTIANKSIDMILCDPPYAITANKWDKPLDLEKMFKEYDRIIKDNGAIVVFGNQPFTTDLINAYRKNFRYSLVWDKNMGTDFFNCNRKPLKSHEDIIVFYKNKPTYNPQKEEGTPYKFRQNNKETISNNGMKANNEIISINTDGTRFPKSVIKVDYTEDDEYQMEEHKDIIVFYKKQPTYNPQKEEGKPYFHNGRGKVSHIEDKGKFETKKCINEGGTRFPKSVIKVDYTEDDEYEMQDHEDIIVFYKKQPTYNPQKEEGKPYKGSKEGSASGGGEGSSSQNRKHKTIVKKQTINDGTRFPKSVIKVDYTEDDEYEMQDHEDIIVFYKKQPTYNPQKEEGKPYIDKRNGTSKQTSHIGIDMMRKQITNDGTRFPKSVIKVDYTEDDEYQMEEHEDIIVFYKKQPTYNPQKEEGKPYKNNCEMGEMHHCQEALKRINFENNGTRFPKTVLKFKRETGKHTTQKPVKLCEWLIKTYTDEGQIVLDNTMGSGTTGVACVNTNRKFIGFELNEKYFETSQERINEAQKHLNRIKNELQDNTGNQSQSESDRCDCKTINPQR